MNIYSTEYVSCRSQHVAVLPRCVGLPIFIRHKFRNQIACDLPALFLFFRCRLHGSNDLTLGHVIGVSANVIARELMCS